MRYLTKKEVVQLIEVIKEQGLDPTWLNYGGFLSTFDPNSYHQNHRRLVQKYAGEIQVSVGPLIYQIEDNKNKDYHLLIKDKDLPALEEAINEELESVRFKEYLRSKYNAYTYEITYLSDSYMEKAKGTEWWFCDKNSPLLPLNPSEERDSKLRGIVEEEIETRLQSIKERGLITVDSFYYRKYYVDVHFRPNTEEWNEYLEYYNLMTNPGVAHQTSRRTNLDKKDLKGFSEYTFKCTGRKVLMKMGRYGTAFVEVDPIII
jgi:hypothetical protein